MTFDDKNCFCELAPLYALGVLSEEERQWVEAQVAACPELAEELTEYEQTIATLAYASPPVAMNPALKDRLFQGLAAKGLQGSSQHSPKESPQPVLESPQPQSNQTWAVRSQSLNWQPYWVAGVMIAILHTNQQTQEVVGLLRAEPNTQYPQHRHAGIEEIYMLEGDLVVGGEVYGPGDYLRSQAGSAHAPYTNEGCMFFFRTSMLDSYADRPLAMAAIGFLAPWIAKVTRFFSQR